MSLLDEAYEDFTIMDKTTKSDGYGGVATVWAEGATVKVILKQNTSSIAQVAQAITEKITYKVITKKNVMFRQGDVIRRERDKRIFRITASADEKETPESASLDMRRCDAEDWELTY